MLSLFLVACVPELMADDSAATMNYAYIRGKDGLFLTVADGAIVFKVVRPGDRTTWNIGVTEKGCRIVDTSSRKYLGIDTKKKNVLAWFDKPDASTLWQLKPVNTQEIRPPKAFKALLIMKIDGDELRLSSDDDGKPILGGKADILKFYIDGL